MGENLENLEKREYHAFELIHPGTAIMSFDISVVDEFTITLVELKTIDRTVDWKRAAKVWGPGNESHRRAMLQMMARAARKELRDEWRERLRVLEGWLRSIAKTPVVAYYVKLIASRRLQRMQVLLRQKLASSAPVERLILRNRPRQLFAAHPPVAPPHFA